MFLSLSANMRRIVSILTLVGGMLILAESAFACMCEGGSQKKAFDHAKKRATAIFVGRAVEVVNGITHGEFPGWRVKLRVEKYWKGHLTEEVIVFTGPSDCASYFVVGDEYLVLAYVPEGKQDLHTDVCMRTGWLPRSGFELKRLGKSKPWLAAKHNNSLHRSAGQRASQIASFGDA
jgi:hypothetical protein